MRTNRCWLGVACLRGQVFAALALLLSLAVFALQFGAKVSPGKQSRTAGLDPGLADRQRFLTSFAHLPLIFEANQGQTDPRVRFLARGSGYALFLTAQSAVLALQDAADRSRHSAPQAAVLSMELVHSNPGADIKGNEKLPGKSNYFLGNDPAQWHANIPQFARVRYADVYPGIDLIYYGNQGRLEYDFEVAPGSDPGLVKFRFGGREPVAIAANGDLEIKLAGGEVRLEAPRVYQRIGEQQRPVQGRFELHGQHEVGIRLGAYDRGHALVIDPVLTYSTYLGGNGNEGCSVILGTGLPLSGCPAVAVDPATNAYIAGSTTSVDFPLGSSPFQSSLRGTANIFVTKFNSFANTLEFSTYLGGNGTDYTAGVGVDSATDVLVGGTTTSTNFPTTTSTYCTSVASEFKSFCTLAFQTSPASAHPHAFVSKLDPTGEVLFYSTYLSGNGTEIASGFAVGESDQNAYIIGTTTSSNIPTATSIFPATLGAYQTKPAVGSTIQFFMSKIVPTLSEASSLAYSTYFGGGNPSSGVALGGGIAVDINNNVYITGGTNFLHVGASNDFPILNAYQGCLDVVASTSTTSCPTSVTATDAFAAEFNPNAVTGSQLLYSTYLGGSGNDIGYGIATDGTNAYVTGSTASADFPITGTGVYQSSYGGGPSDAFLAKLANPITTGSTPGLVTLGYSTFLGGLATDVGLAVAVDNEQGARLAGWTNSPNIPELNNSIQAGYAGGNDAFVARIDTTGTTPTAPGHYFTYLGGTGADYGTGIAVDPLGSSYVAGETNSSNFLQIPTTPQYPPFQSTLLGTTDAFLSKLGPTISLTLTGTSSPPVVGVGNQVTFNYTISNTGDLASNIIFTDTLPPSGASFTSATVSSGSCGSATGTIVSCTIGTLNSGATSTATIILTPTAGITPSLTTLTLGNTASVTVAGCSSCTQSLTTSTLVNDYNIGVSPNYATVPAGVPATYTATLTPTGNIPNNVSITCSAGLPNGATCTEVPPSPVPNLSNGPVSFLLVINTTTRVTTTTDKGKRGGPLYATWLPLSGLALLSMGMRGSAGKRRWLVGFLVVASLSLVFFPVGCAKSSVTTTSGTPAGTYIVTVSATSGTATRNVIVTLVVQ
ncbi:MAG TPA: SBBP repeat-containing protein [Terriglobales bacterium]|nr:SBBP repeat-containing protein [Terriglobales bacterium]